MKRQFLAQTFAVATVILIGLAIAKEPGYSQDPSGQRPPAGQRGFWCDESSDIPTSMYQNARGDNEPWIRWTSDYFSGSGYDPLTRCQQVSARLETYRQNRQLRYITIGTMNRQPVICAAIEVNGPCDDRLIYTLKPEQDPTQTLNSFLAWREGQAGLPSLYESTLQRPYIDVQERLEMEVESQTPEPLAPPINVRPVPGKLAPDDLREL